MKVSVSSESAVIRAPLMAVSAKAVHLQTRGSAQDSPRARRLARLGRRSHPSAACIERLEADPDPWPWELP